MSSGAPTPDLAADPATPSGPDDTARDEPRARGTGGRRARTVAAIARKSLVELMREPMLLWLMLLFPTMVIAFYYVGFGQTRDGLSNYLEMLVLNSDAAVTNADGASWSAGDDLVDSLRAVEFEGQAVFDVHVVDDRGKAETSLREHKATLLLVVPPDFSRRVLEATAGTAEADPARLTLVGDQGADAFLFSRSFLETIVREFGVRAAGWEVDPLSIDYEMLPGTGTMSDFDWGVGGIIVFGVTFLILSTATLMARERVSGTLNRLRLTRADAADVLVGTTLAQMIVCAVQVPATFGAALAFGFHSSGSLVLAMVIALITSLSAVGLGLVVACWARNEGDAINLASVAMVPYAFLSGALFPMPDAPVLALAGHTVEIYDFLPTTHAANAMRQVFFLGAGPVEIAYELAMLCALSLLTLAVGVALYQRFVLRQA